MALSKKDAKRVVNVLNENISNPVLRDAFDRVKDLGIKNKSFNKTVKRLRKALEPKKKSALKAA